MKRALLLLVVGCGGSPAPTRSTSAAPPPEPAPTSEAPTRETAEERDVARLCELRIADLPIREAGDAIHAFVSNEIETDWIREPWIRGETSETFSDRLRERAAALGIADCPFADFSHATYWLARQEVHPHAPCRDRDRDGVEDCADVCPGTAAGVAVEMFGCPPGALSPPPDPRDRQWVHLPSPHGTVSFERDVAADGSDDATNAARLLLEAAQGTARCERLSRGQEAVELRVEVGSTAPTIARVAEHEAAPTAFERCIVRELGRFQTTSATPVSLRITFGGATGGE